MDSDSDLDVGREAGKKIRNGARDTSLYASQLSASVSTTPTANSGPGGRLSKRYSSSSSTPFQTRIDSTGGGEGEGEGEEKEKRVLLGRESRGKETERKRERERAAKGERKRKQLIQKVKNIEKLK